MSGVFNPSPEKIQQLEKQYSKEFNQFEADSKKPVPKNEIQLLQSFLFGTAEMRAWLHKWIPPLIVQSRIAKDAYKVMHDLYSIKAFEEIVAITKIEEKFLEDPWDYQEWSNVIINKFSAQILKDSNAAFTVYMDLRQRYLDMFWQDISRRYTWENAMAALKELQDQLPDKMEGPSDDLEENILASLREQEALKDKGLPGLYGMPFINHWMGGHRLGNMYIFAAEPGGGKSVSGLNFARYVWRQPKEKVCVVNYEMDFHECAKRWLQMIYGATEEIVDSWDVKDYERLLRKQFENGRMEMTDVMTMDVDALLEWMQVRVKQGCRWFLLDYIQLIPTRTSYGVHENLRITEVSSKLRKFAKVNNIHITALAQLKRIEGRKKLHDLQDLAGSAQLERDASVVCFFFDAMDANDENKRGYYARVMKNRAGKKARKPIRLWAEFDVMQLRQWRYRDEDIAQGLVWEISRLDQCQTKTVPF